MKRDYRAFKRKAIYTKFFTGPFTVYDFVKAYLHFSDPEWDGEPMEPDPCKRCGKHPCTCIIEPPQECPVCGKLPCECEPEPCPKCGQRPCVCRRKIKIKVKLADGKERTIQHMVATTFWSPDGTPISAAQFIERLFGELPDLFKDEDELRQLWSKPDTRKKLLAGLEEKGFGGDQLAEVRNLIDADRSDLFDVLAYIRFNHPTITREERVQASKPSMFQHYSDKQQEFLDFVLAHYIDQGVTELDQEKLPSLLELKYHSVNDAVTQLGSVAEIRDVFVGFQGYLYQPLEGQ